MTEMPESAPRGALRARRAAALLAVAACALLAPTAPAHAKSVVHKDPIRGFECKIDGDLERVPPKPGDDTLHIAGEWYDPSAKYGRGFRPHFRIIWSVKPKGEKAAEFELPAWARNMTPQQQAYLRALSGGTEKNLDTELDRYLSRRARMYGEYVPMEERWAALKKPRKLKTRDKRPVMSFDINYGKKNPKRGEPFAWLWAAKTEWETDTQEIQLGFYGYASIGDSKDYRRTFESIVKSFRVVDVEEPAEDEPEPDPSTLSEKERAEQKIQKFIAEKIPKGWDYIRTENYLVVFDKDVDRKKIVNRVVREIEALREQVYEVMFPPDRPIYNISVVRVLETRAQYMAYGAPGGSAGYWSPSHEELVLFQNKNDKRDAIRVLYHEAFHQYIHYSVGKLAPHSWFNEGHGDFFSGHVYKGGKFHREVFSWRTGLAQTWKKKWENGEIIHREDGRRLRLAEWLKWRQRQYYGGNNFTTPTAEGRRIPQGANYALGWSFIYFLRETKNEQYQRILPVYFDTLKSFVTAAHEKALADSGLDGGGGGPAKPGEPGEPGEPGKSGESGGGDGPVGENPGESGDDTTAPKPADGRSVTSDEVSRSEWHGEALKTALRGIDMDQLEKDWLDHRW